MRKPAASLVVSYILVIHISLRPAVNGKAGASIEALGEIVLLLFSTRTSSAVVTPLDTESVLSQARDTTRNGLWPAVLRAANIPNLDRQTHQSRLNTYDFSKLKLCRRKTRLLREREGGGAHRRGFAGAVEGLYTIYR